MAAETGGYLLVGQFGPGDGGDNALAMKVDDADGVEWVRSLQGHGGATLSAAANSTTADTSSPAPNAPPRMARGGSWPP